MLLFIIALRIFVSYNLLCTKYYTSYRPNQLISIAWHREAAEVEEEVVAAEGELPPRKPQQQKRKRLKRLVSFYQNLMLPLLFCPLQYSFTNISNDFFYLCSLIK